MDDKKIFIYQHGNNTENKSTIAQNIPPLFTKNLELKQALNSMYAAWMPLNEVVYNSIKNKVIQRAYDNNRGKFIQDISTDFTILSLILREMPSIITSRESIDPVKFLKSCDIEQFKNIFLKEASEYSLHSFNDINDSQAVMYKYTAISSQISQKYAVLNNQDPLWIYVISVLRGLANCLLSWNYPRLFSRGLKAQVNQESTLDDFIERALGFSPNDLIVELITTWNLNDNVRDYVDNTRSVNKDNLTSKCIYDSEMIAKLHEPKVFPDVINKLDDYKDEISGTKNISKVISKEVSRVCEYYEKYSPEIFDLTMSIKDKIKEAILAHADNKLRKNTFIFQCDDSILNSFKKVYVNMSDDKFSKKALEVLRYETINKAGFENGCLYVYNEQKNTLIPTLKIGERELYKYREVSCEKNISSSSMISDALKCTVPIRNFGVSVTGEYVSYICASFGNSFKRGVLYLEYSNDDEDMDGEMMSRFKAILKCLNECLGFSVN